MRRYPSISTSPFSSSIPLMSTSTLGAVIRSFSSGIRLCPPARTLASPCCASAETASERDCGAAYSNRDGYMRVLPSFGCGEHKLYDRPVTFGSVDELDRSLREADY